MENIKEYYDDLAKHYKLVYSDWEASVSRQAKVLEQVIAENLGSNVKRILDASCGIGTQAIGLAEVGFEVSASDISEQEIRLAKQESARRKLKIDFRIGDMRQVNKVFTGKFDAVIACDNSIPHLLTDDDILQAFSAFFNVINPGGGVVISVRDYDQFAREGRRLYPRHIHQSGSSKTIIFDVWEFMGDIYDMTTYIIEDDGVAPPISRAIRGGRYYCVGIKRLEDLLKGAGFAVVKTIRNVYFQPLLVAVKGTGTI